MKIVLRMCCVCRKKQNKNDMVRLVNTNEDIVVDNKKNFNGKATYVCKTSECLDVLVKKRILNKVFRKNIKNEIYDKLKEELVVANSNDTKN